MAELTHSGIQLHQKFNWRTFGFIWALAAIGLITVVPYSLTLSGGIPANPSASIPVWLLITVQIGVQIILFGVLAGIGLYLADRIGLGAPLISDWLQGHPVKERVRGMLLPSVLIGLIAAGTVVVLDVLFVAPRMRATGISLPANVNPPAWQGFLASFYGAFDEEILMRLFTLTLLAWIGSRFSRTKEGRPTLTVLWIANLLAAILFGLGHLPATQAAGLPLNGLVISRAIVLNGLAGIAFGWLYWSRGLGSAMLAHFSGDILLHVIVPILL